MDIRVLKARLENALTNETSEEYFREQIKAIVDDINNEVEVSDRTIDSGMIATVVDELRHYYFSLLDEYGAIPKTTNTMVKRANVLDELTITLSKIINFMSYAVTRNASSSDPSIQRICAIIKPEMESYRKEMYNLGTLMQNLMLDKKIYLEKLKERNDG